MAIIKEQAHFRHIPKEVIVRAIESISEGLIDDARFNYGKEPGFDATLEVNPNKGLIFCVVRFIPYEYRFKWLVAPEKDGYLVTFIGSTPGKWYEFLFYTKQKLAGLVETQWSALYNFAVGFVAAQLYLKAPKKGKKKISVKEHIKKAATHVKKRKKEEHVKTAIG
ncbi:MAG: hypothetical protein J7K68_06460 [Candidatus Diapherotrites archaeon]|nr:hypothetical protein [Candidatus Diapherotrites archaeon]